MTDEEIALNIFPALEVSANLFKQMYVWEILLHYEEFDHWRHWDPCDTAVFNALSCYVCGYVDLYLDSFSAAHLQQMQTYWKTLHLPYWREGTACGRGSQVSQALEAMVEAVDHWTTFMSL